MADGKVSLGSREKISKSVGPGGKFVLTVWFTYIRPRVRKNGLYGLFSSGRYAAMA